MGKTRQARIISGDIFGKHEVTDQVADVRLLLAPLAIEDVKTVRCLGLNYEKHAIEVRRSHRKPLVPVCLTDTLSVQAAHSQVPCVVCKSSHQAQSAPIPKLKAGKV